MTSAAADSSLPAAPRLICASILFALKWTFLLLVATFVLNLSALHKEEEALRPLGIFFVDFCTLNMVYDGHREISLVVAGR